MMDLAPYDRFTLITGIAGEAWEDAAARCRTSSASPLDAVVIGPGRPVTDLYYDWAKLREVEEGGALLVRPDKHIAWRSHSRCPPTPGPSCVTRSRQVLGARERPVTLAFDHETLAQRVRFGVRRCGGIAGGRGGGLRAGPA